jgi:hypothetical protein
VDLAEARKPLPRFALPVSVRANLREEMADVESFNVAGIIRGSDPSLSKEYVVLSAHLDHLGIGPAVAGDTIYNGAMDNASGCAALLDFAEWQHASGVHLRRSMLLVFVTAEEKGLLGSRWFAVHPTVPSDSMVADLNIDMFLPLFPLRLVRSRARRIRSRRRRPRRRGGLWALRCSATRSRSGTSSSGREYSFRARGIPSVMVDVAAPRGIRRPVS